MHDFSCFIPRLLAGVMIACGAAAGVSAEPATIAAPQALTVTRTVVWPAGYDYLLSLPRGYADEPARRWPVLVFLHGSGECGTDVKRVAVNGPPKLLSPGATLTDRERAAAAFLHEHFIVVSPQCRSEGIGWEDERVLGVMDDVAARFRVDGGRVYLTGISMGGYGVWNLIWQHADRFAAAVPISAGGSYLDALNALDGTAPHMAELRSLAVWAFHGARDDIVPVAEDSRLTEALTKAGGDARVTVDPERGHDVWTTVYADAEVYAWLLRHGRRP
jgi:predicted peptidase